MGKIYDALEKFETENNTDSLETENDVYSEKNETGLPSHSDVKNEPLRRNNNLDLSMVVFNDPLSYAAEQFRMLRSRILFPLEGEPLRTIMVTSASQGEGKSFTAANLAISIADGINDHVLLIDCDIRNSSQQKLFGFGAVRGLSDYLRGRRELESILLKTSINKLTLLPGGKRPTNPAELLSSKRMSSLLVEVRERYKRSVYHHRFFSSPSYSGIQSACRPGRRYHYCPEPHENAQKSG